MVSGVLLIWISMNVLFLYIKIITGHPYKGASFQTDGRDEPNFLEERLLPSKLG